MNNSETWNMIETLYNKIELKLDIPAYANIDAEKILNKYLNSDFYNLESELKYIGKVAKLEDMRVGTNVVHSLLVGNLVNYNPIGVKTLYNLLTLDNKLLQNKLKMNNKALHSNIDFTRKQLEKLKNGMDNLIIPGFATITNIQTNFMNEFDIKYESIYFIGINKQATIIGMSDNSGDEFDIYKATERLEFLKDFNVEYIIDSEVGINFDLLKDIISIQELDMLFI